ncbi:MAG: hypothetical protein NTY09_08280 [bacterium]|nr:hypothetical protein [bacterium]
MNLKKILGDILFVVIVIVFALTVFGSRKPGPVELASRLSQGQQTASLQGGNATSDQQQVQHNFAQNDISDGDPVISLGDNQIGRDWFIESVENQAAQLNDGKMDAESLNVMAELVTLEEGTISLISGQLQAEYGISPDPNVLAENESNFYSNFSTREEAESTALQMGMTMDQLRAHWAKESVDKQLQELFSGASGVPVDSEGFEDAYYNWLIDKIFTADWVFNDPEFEGKFNNFLFRSFNKMCHR